MRLSNVILVATVCGPPRRRRPRQPRRSAPASLSSSPAVIPTATLSSPDDTTRLVGRGWGHTEADTVDKASLRGLQMAAMVTARLLLHVSRDEAFPGRRRSRDEVLEQLRDAGLEDPLRRSGRLELAGGRDQ